MIRLWYQAPTGFHNGITHPDFALFPADLHRAAHRRNHRYTSLGQTLLVDQHIGQYEEPADGRTIFGVE